MSTVVFASAFATAVVSSVASHADLVRARQSVPGEHLRGPNAAVIHEKLNSALQSGALAMPRSASCDQFSLGELSDLERNLFNMRSEDLFTADLRAPRHVSLASLEAEIEEELEYAAKFPEALSALRDGKCAEVAMAWVHHLTEESRASLAHVRFPLLSGRGTQEHGPELLLNGHHHVAKKLASKVTCQVGHDAQAVARGTWEGFPAWPFEVTYNATGYGPYPFWTLGGGSGGSLTEGAPIQTWWSSVLNAERLDHNGECSITGLGFSKDAPCTHLFLGNKYAYLFDQEQTHCCISSTPDYACHLTTMQRDFYKVFNYEGTIDNYVSESGYYSGTVKKYSMHLTQPPNFWFWYVTDLEDRPIEQGEGPCDMYSVYGGRNCWGPPKMLFHQYNPETFKEATLDADVFALPEVCKKTTQTCEVQPTNFCGDASSPGIVV